MKQRRNAEYRKVTKMVEINTTMLIITLNVSDSNTLVKRYSCK